MPRKKGSRRFDPPTLVSREVIQHEARYVAKEVEDYLVLSTNDVRRFLSERRAAWTQANEVLKRQLCRLPEREQSALQALLVRDSYHLFELYIAHVETRIAGGEVYAPPKSVTEAPTLPFSEWLFGTPD